MRLMLFIFLFSSCASNELEIHVSEKYEGPVVIIEDYSRPENIESKVTIDSIALKKAFVNHGTTSITIFDKENRKVKEYDLNQGDLSGSNDRMIFHLGQTSITNYCEGEDVDYIYFYIGTYKNFKEYSVKYSNDELQYFEKNGISFCDFLGR